MATLERPKRLRVNLADHEIVFYAPLYSNHIAFPRFGSRPTDPTIAVKTIVALDQKSVDIQRRRLNE
jgi:hypothetical protein